MDDRETKDAEPFQITQNQPICVVENTSGEVRIQLEGSHTSTSETDPKQAKSRLCVQFEDNSVAPCCTSSLPYLRTTKDGDSDNNFGPHKQLSTETLEGKKLDLDLMEIEKENKAIGLRFQQIIDMFDAFTKNLETLEFQTPTTPKSTCDRQIGTRQQNDEVKVFASFEETVVNINSVPCSDLHYQNVTCQTSLHEDFSIGQGSIMRSASGTSRSDLQQSLNNYARAENALKIITPADGHPLKVFHPTEPDHCRSGVISEEPCSQPFNTIHIEALSTTSSSALHRPPLCQRMWDVVTDFCAAIFLCLQVNRDTIICLGFFAAFVVSASFLTAFFYRTLSVSPPLWQSSLHPLVLGETESTSGSNTKSFV